MFVVFFSGCSHRCQTWICLHFFYRMVSIYYVFELNNTDEAISAIWFSLNRLHFTDISTLLSCVEIENEVLFGCWNDSRPLSFQQLINLPNGYFLCCGHQITNYLHILHIKLSYFYIDHILLVVLSIEFSFTLLC